MRYTFVFLAFCGLAFASCGDDDPVATGDTAELELSFVGSVLDEPLALESETFQAASVAEGFRVTRTSFFLSDIRLVEEVDGLKLETPVSEIAYVALGPAGEADVRFPQIPHGTYSSIRFRVGLTEEQDTSTPDDFAASNPLSRNAEYWVDWGSYIFLKIEGRSDTLANNEPRFDASFVYHIGKSSELAREIELPVNLTVAGATTSVQLGVDVGVMLGLDGDEPQALKRVADHRNVIAPTIMSNTERAFSISL